MKSFFLLLAIVVAWKTNAQHFCSSPVTQGEMTCTFDLNAWPGTQPVIGKLEEPFRPYGCYWLCNGDTLILNGADDLRVWAESGSYIFLDTTGVVFPTPYFGAIWLKDGAILDMLGGAGMYNASATIIREPGSIVTQPSIFTNIENCGDVSFIYPATFPVGCDTTHVIQTGVRQIRPEQGISLFPNPTSGELNIQGLMFEAGDEVKIFDLLGKEVYFTQFSNTTANVKIQTANMKNGVYFVNVKTENKTETKKIIVQH